MLADYHMHTNFSDDSTYRMEDEIKKAISLGLDEICFTEHMDYGIDTVIDCDCTAYREELLRCKEKYGEQIALKFGIEFGMQTHTVAEYQETFNAFDFDFVILSFHQVDNKEFHTQQYQNGKSQIEYNRGYYNEILNVMKIYDDFSILGHLDVIKRYDLQGDCPLEYVEDIITEILKYVIAHGKGIEVNTSCFRYGLKDLTPSTDILKLYKNLGGTIITIGSDSHEEAHVGYKIGHVKEVLKQLGFTHFYTFDQMKPIPHLL